MPKIGVARPPSSRTACSTVPSPPSDSTASSPAPNRPSAASCDFGSNAPAAEPAGTTKRTPSPFAEAASSASNPAAKGLSMFATIPIFIAPTTLPRRPRPLNPAFSTPPPLPVIFRQTLGFLPLFAAALSRSAPPSPQEFCFGRRLPPAKGSPPTAVPPLGPPPQAPLPLLIPPHSRSRHRVIFRLNIGLFAHFPWCAVPSCPAFSPQESCSRARLRPPGARGQRPRPFRFSRPPSPPHSPSPPFAFFPQKNREPLSRSAEKW